MNVELRLRPDRRIIATTSRPAPVRGVIPELDPVVVEYPAEVILLSGENPAIIHGTAQSDAQGETIVTIPVASMPPPGTPIQVVVHIDPELAPVVIEGLTAGGDQNGVINIIIAFPDETGA